MGGGSLATEECNFGSLKAAENVGTTPITIGAWEAFATLAFRSLIP